MSETYSKIGRELLRAIRGSMTQVELSRALGFRYNQYNRWESGERQINWGEFERLCEVRKIPLRTALDHFLVIHPGMEIDASSPGQLIRQFCRISGSTGTHELARKLHVHPSSVRRWLLDEVDPGLVVMLNILDLQGNLALFMHWMRNAPDPASDAAVPRPSDQELLHRYFIQYPWSLMILTAVQAESRGILLSESALWSKRVGIREVRFRRAVDDLVTLGAFEIRKGRLHAKPDRVELSGIPLQGIVRAISYFTSRVVRKEEVFLGGSGTDSAGHRTSDRILLSDYRLLAMSRSAQEEVHQAFSAFIGELKRINDSDPGPKDQLSGIVMHWFEPGIVSSQDDFESDWLRKFGAGDRSTELNSWIAQREKERRPLSRSTVGDQPSKERARELSHRA